MNMKNLRYKIIFLLLASFIVSYSYSQTCPSGMVSYWKLEETNSKTFDDANGTNDATSDQNLGSDASGRVGNAIIVDSNTVDIPSSTSYNFGVSSSFSIELWVKFTDVTTGIRDHIFIGRNDPYVSGSYWCIGAEHNTGKIFFDLRDANGNIQSISSSAAMNNGSWHQVIAVRDESTNKNILYIDGTAVANIVYDYPAGFASNAYISLGYLLRNGVPAYVYRGELDEVVIYNRALSQTDVNDHYSKGNLGIGVCDGYNPNIISIPNEKATVGSPYSYTVRATGIQAGMTYSLVTKPTGMTINASSGVISWTPASVNVDAYVQVRAFNNIAPADTQSYRIFLADAPVCPNNLLFLLKLDETSGPTYFDFYGSHNGTASPSPSATTGKINGGQTFNASSKIDLPTNGSEFSFTSGSSFSIELWIKTAASGTQVCVSRNRTDLPAFPNIAMWFVGTHDGGVAGFELRDNGGNLVELSGSSAINDGAWHHILAVRDGTAGMNYLYVDGEEEDSKSANYSNSFMSDVATPVTLGYMQRINSGDNEYHFVGSMDEVALYNRAVTSSEAATFYNNGNPTGHCALGNYLPVVTSIPVTSVNEDVPYSYTFSVNDIDASDVLTLSAPTKPAWLSFNFTPGQKSATLSGTPSNDNVGNHPVTLRVSDGHGTKDQAFTLVVNNVNDAPSVTSSPQVSVNEDVAYSYTLTVADVDVADVINIAVVSKPAWLNFAYTPGAKTAILSGTPGNGDTGTTNLEINVSDGTATVPAGYTLTVVPVNDPPVISAQVALSTDEDVAIILQKSDFTITDVDNAAGDVTLKIKAGSNYTFTGTTVTPAADYSGVLHVTVVASDLNDDSQDYVADITVNAINDPPVVSNDPDLTVNVGELYAYVFAATDPDDATLTKSVVQKPDWLGFSASTGVLTGTPTQDDRGQTLIILRVSDGKVDVDYDFILDVIGESGLNDLESAGIKVYPVPAKDYLNISFESLTEATQLELISSTGSVVRKMTLPSNTEKYALDLKGVENGAYYIHFVNSKLNNIGRIVIVK
jgi:hypothetical protein